MSALSWWRSWHGAPTDHKWAVIAARSGVKVGIVSAIAWALLDYASQHANRGSVAGFDTEEYSVYSGFSEDEIKAVIQAMTDKGIISDGRFANWEKRQPKREDDSSERVRKSREAKRIVTQSNANDNAETPQIKIKDTDTELKKGADAPSLEEPAASPEEMVQSPIVENNEVDQEPLEESIPPSENQERPSREIKFSDPSWDVLHGRIPTTPINPQPDMEWIPPDLKDLAEVFLEASNLPGPKDKSSRGYWIASLRTMRLDDRLTQDDVRRAVKKMRSTGGIIKSPESVRSVAVDIRAACGPVFYAEEY